MRSLMTRRRLLQALGTSGAVASLPAGLAWAAAPAFTHMPGEGADTPKVCLGFGDPVDEDNKGTGPFGDVVNLDTAGIGEALVAQVRNVG